MKKRKWFWITLFVLTVTLATGLATGWNFVLVRDHYRILDILKKTAQEPLQYSSSIPWVQIAAGSLGFGILITALVLFFIRLLQEMKLNQLQTDFLAQFSHELKTPLASIELSSQLLHEAHLNKSDLALTPDEQNKLWSNLSTELLRLRNDVESILHAARLEAIPTAPQMTEASLLDWFEEALIRWQRVLGANAEIQVDLYHAETQPKQKIYTDSNMLSLITDNIIQNAQKFAIDKPKIFIRLETNQKDWVLSLRDSGWGFQKKDSKRIFKRFARAKTTSPKSIAGTGLGLYLAKVAANKIRVQLSAESPGPNQGSTFTLKGEFPV